MAIRMLALDLDGTLLQKDDRMHPRDVDAIHRARAAGVRVTIATGRITSGALRTAQTLGLHGPMVCADGAVIADAETGALMEHTPIEASVVEGLTHAHGRHAVKTFWFTHDEIHGEFAAASMVDYVRVWSPRVHLHTQLPGSAAWTRRHEVAMAVGLGERDDIERVVAWVAKEHAGAAYVASFPAFREDHWAVLVRNPTTNKGAGLARMSHTLGIASHEVAVVGDWINDVPMFRWAGRSFAMGQSHDDVSKHATDKLTSTRHTGGGVAEAIDKLFG